MSVERHVYFFGNGRADGSAAMRDILGGKGAGLAEMANLGLPVPPGFTISAKLCITYLEEGTFPAALRAEVDRHLKQLEKVTGKGLGDARNPLLVSVRSGAAVSMPGMMETILNLGLNDQTVEGLIAGSNNPRFAYDSYRRFVQMYGDVVFDLGKEPFEEVLTKAKTRRKVERDIDLPAEDLRTLVREFRAIVQSRTGRSFPDDPQEQLWGAIEAVFKSWNTRRAKDYRQLNNIPDSLGTETVGDVVELAIVFRAACVPTLEDGFDRSPELLLWIVGEGPPRPRLHDRPELPDQCPQVLGGKIDVPLDLATRFGLGEDLFKRLFAEIKDDITVHLDETAVGIVGEARIIGAGNQPFDGLIVEAQVQNGLHHPRHRDGGARADRDEQRIPRVAQSLARDFFQLLQVAIDFGAERRGERAFFEIGDAELGGDREAGRDGKSQIGHLR